jgi:hypothetical protein
MKNIIREVAVGYDLEQQVSDNLYHNTRALLELYNKVLWRINSSLDELDQECRESTNRQLTELIDSLVEIDPRVNEARLNSRLRSIEHSKSILDFIDLSMKQLRTYPENGERYYDILLGVYIERREKPIESLAETYCVSRATLYRDKKKAINMFGVILWGYLVSEAS